MNFKPFSSSFCYASVNVFLDKLIICIVLLVAAKFGARVLEIVDCPGLKDNLDTRLCSDFLDLLLFASNSGVFLSVSVDPKNILTSSISGVRIFRKLSSVERGWSW